MAEQTVFADGMYYSEPRDSAPDFVLGSISVHKARFAKWVEEQEANKSGYINLSVLRSKAGKPYVKLDTYKPEETKAEPEPESKPAPALDETFGGADDIPF